jgi:hypothetical protein
MTDDQTNRTAHDLKTPEPSRLAQLLKAEGLLIDAVRAGELLPDRTWRVALAGIQKSIEREIANAS